METFEAIYRKYRDLVLHFAIQCGVRREIAEELTAEAFLELHRHWETIELERLPSWLLTVVKNRAADHWRRKELERRYMVSELPPIQTPSPPSRPAQAILFENAALKPVHRICLTLRYIQEMTVAEIAERLGLSEIQVKGHLQYARELLRKQLAGEASR
jgi:RNA polymerase sigma-70 factor (ECF subfamily)